MSASVVLPPKFTRPVPDDKRYKDRLALEFDLIDKNGFTQVFIQVQTILGFMSDISHIIRGSAGSSLVCWLLGISASDPILYSLELARFMNEGRQDMPDIDIDVPYNRRDELYARIANAFPGRVARISNHVMYQHKSALREAIRQSGVKGRIPKHFKLSALVDDVGAVKQMASELEGTQRLTSLHCGGIVIFDGPVPPELIIKEKLELVYDKKAPICQISLDKDETEDAGYIKIDLLSNRGLAQAIEVAGSGLWDEIPSSWLGQIRRVFCEGDNIGITFGESRGMRRIFADLRPQTIEEIAIALALIRPAAASDGRKKSFITKYNQGTVPTGKEAPIVYDDDAIKRICAVLSCPPAVGDKWRKAFAKGNSSTDFERELALRGLENSVKQRSLLADLHQLSKYSFCKSHALSYAFLVWRLAYLKIRWPHEFWVSTLNHCNSDYRKWVHLREARNAGLLLSRSPGPYKLGLRGGLPALIPLTGGEQMILTREDSLKQIEKDIVTLGYWCTEAFIPGAEFRLYKETPEARDLSVAFCGIVATTRLTHGLTLICIGVANGKFVDLVIQGTNTSLLGFAVEGTGLYRGGICETVQVEHIRSISVSTLMAKCRCIV